METCVYIGTLSEIVGRFHRRFSDFIKHELAINETSELFRKWHHGKGGTRRRSAGRVGMWHHGKGGTRSAGRGGMWHHVKGGTHVVQDEVGCGITGRAAHT